MTNFLPKNHPKIYKKTGVLLLNLGSPDGYDYFSVRRYLKQFLSDRRVIEVNPILWQIILNLFILTFRPLTTGKKYKSIWFHEINEAPLKFFTKSQAKKLAKEINNEQILVDFAMRYGSPSIEQKINEMVKNGCQKILCIPLYPQYCSATTATICDEIYRVIKKIRWQPEVRIVGQYCDNEQYIKALVNSVKNHLEKIDFTPDAILSSYHGIPQEYFDKGDPYSCYCNKTNRLFNEELANQKIDIKNYISFQSRFGPKQWLQPYTADVIKDLVENKNVKNLLVITPGFAADCIETLEEVAMEYKELFIELGGKNYEMIPCLNDNNDHIKLIKSLMEDNLWR